MFRGLFQLVGVILIRQVTFQSAESATGVARNALSKLQILIKCERGCSKCNSGASAKVQMLVQIRLVNPRFGPTLNPPGQQACETPMRITEDCPVCSAPAAGLIPWHGHAVIP